MNRINFVEQEYLKEEMAEIAIGDTIRVYVKVREGDKERLQPFEGLLIGRSGDGARETITVRRTTHGVGVERIFPLHSPNIAKIAVKRKGEVRRAKLYFIRKLRGKAARVKEKRRTRPAARGK
ncbi:50S ribosomal protein L19 [bacterium]|nr:50S ribosomal protein L19 [bacterium]